MEEPRQCPHFAAYRCIRTIFLPSLPECKHCGYGKQNLWLCLLRDCQELHCGRHQFDHIKLHLEQSKNKKTFHSLFINILTAQIYCIACQIFIQDSLSENNNFNSPLKQENKLLNSAFRLRTKILPFLSELGNFKISGQIENSEAHRKVNSGSVGIFSNKVNYSIHSALLFISHCHFFRDIILAMRVQQNNLILLLFQQVVKELHEAKYRAIHSDKFDSLILAEKPHLLTYQRKDPFEIVLFLLYKLHDSLSYFMVQDQLQERDEWDLFYSKGQLKKLCPIFNSLKIKLKLNYYCSKCKTYEHYVKTINYLKLTLCKKKRANKEVERELKDHRMESPLKHRKKSLMNLFFKEEEMPITVHQLIIEMTKRPLHKDKNCEHCKEPLKKTKIQFQSLPNYLIIQVSRVGSEGYSIDETPISFSTETVDFGAFTVNKEKQMYQFQTAIGVEKGGFFPVMARNSHNKQLQIFRSQNISYSQKLNPYIICYKKLTQRKQDDLKVIGSQQRKYKLPDFWSIQVNYSFQTTFYNPFVCKHGCFKPYIQSKENQKELVSGQLYERIIHTYYGKWCQTYDCVDCEQDLKRIEERRNVQKEAIKKYDSVKTQIQCMIAIDWISRWSNFIYKKGGPNYTCKGYPLPGRIDNRSILEGKKCRPNLVQNRDFKVVNLYVWRFLKQLYGGGTEIRFKWKKEGSTLLNEQMLEQIKVETFRLRNIFEYPATQSPSKKSSTMEQTSYIHQSSEIEPSGGEFDL